MIARTAACTRAGLTAVIGLSLLASLSRPPTRAAGWGFIPSPREYESWPQYCRVQYSYINRGANAYGDYYPDSAIADWRDKIGEHTFISLPHYCAAWLYLKRLKLETRPDIKANLLSRVSEDATYTYERS